MTPSFFEAALVFAGGALVVVGLGAVARAALTAGLEPRGHWLDRWRRVWFHPERELSLLVGAVLVAAFVGTFGGRYRLPGWVTPVLFAFWALHLPADGWNWVRTRGNPRGTRALHERGFFLLDRGPLWLRAALALLAAGLDLFIPPLRAVLDGMMAFILASLQGWFS